jgi:Leucine-rich repeat (LRR) protein
MEIQKEKHMFNFFKPKPKIIKQLEKIGKKYVRGFNNIPDFDGKKSPKLLDSSFYSVNYVQNEHDQITELSLRGLPKLPPEIGNLQNLMKLFLYKNLSSISLPPEIGNLQNLTKLNLYNNKLTQFPKALLDLNLEVKWTTYGDGICVRDNPFQTPPVEIVKQGRQTIIDYYSALKEEA